MYSISRLGTSRIAWSFSLLLFSSILLHADVPVTGTISSSYSFSRYANSQSIDIALTGSSFSLNSSIGTDNLINFSPAFSSVTFLPPSMTSDAMPLLIAGGSNSGTLVYNGTNYTNLQISLHITASPATVANNGSPNPRFFYNASVKSVPFSLTGSVSAYAVPPSSSGFTGDTPLVTVSFSGGGLFSIGALGDFPASGSGGSSGSATYTLLANPINFTSDTATQGAWPGNYGGEGYLIANGPMFLPSYAAVSVSQASTYTWVSQTSDLRALLDGLNAPSGIASSYYANSFNINIAFTDHNPHRVALYLLDFDTANTRNETLTVTNATTGAPIDTETITDFSNGVYAIWNLQGNVTINVKRNSGASAAVSAIFFGPPATIQNVSTATPSSTALFHGTNTTVQGAWPGNYGSSGYSIANASSVPSTLGMLNVTGATTYTWVAQTLDPRALHGSALIPNGIASAYTQYPDSSFKINVSTSSVNTMALLSLYLLDWDNEGRSETITLTDVSTGVVLDTETFSNFQTGIYASWIISGNVVVTVTPNGSTSPAVSGIFIN